VAKQQHVLIGGTWVPTGGAPGVPGPPGAPGADGAEGPQGPPGGVLLAAQWDFNQSTTVSPATGTMRMDATTYPAVTFLWISELDRDNLDRNAGLNEITVGDQIIMQSAQGRAVWDVTSHADSGTYRTIGVTLVESAGTRPNAESKTTIYIVTEASVKHLILDEGTPLAARAGLNFTGTGVTVTDDAGNDRSVVTIPGASGGSTILSGTATPTGATGALGDYYLDTDDRILYGPKVDGSVAVYGPNQSAHTSQTESGSSTGKVAASEIIFNVPGRVTGITFHRNSGSALSGVTLKLWTQGGALLGTCATTGDTGSGWKTAYFATPILVTAGQIVRASGEWATAGTFSTFTLGSNIGNSDLVLMSTGYYSTSAGAFPNTATAEDYLIDVIFQKDTTTQWPVALKSVPPGGTTGQFLKKTGSEDYAVGWVT
jgi:Domain of unknown function (DUF4082)